MADGNNKQRNIKIKKNILKQIEFAANIFYKITSYA